MPKQDPSGTPFDRAAESVIELGNRIMDQDSTADVWEVASGLLAGAVQFWLFSRQPCDDPPSAKSMRYRPSPSRRRFEPPVLAAFAAFLMASTVVMRLRGTCSRNRGGRRILRPTAISTATYCGFMRATALLVSEP